MAETARHGAEHFVPIRKSELAARLCDSAGLLPAEAEALRSLYRLLEARFHFEYHRQLEDLKDAYAAFDPDADTVPLAEVSQGDRRIHLDRLFEKFAWLVERGNFRRLSQAEIDESLKGASDWGLNLAVDFEVFDRLEIYARGDLIGSRSRRNWRTRFRWVESPVPIFQRLVVIFKLRPNARGGPHLDTQDVFLKLFKDIPKMDLEMLLPGTRVQMSLLDRAKIVLPTISGVAITIWKIVKGALLAAAVGVYGFLALLGLIAGTVGYGVRSFYGYLQTKQKYQLSLTQSLYYQNLDNNAGVLFRLLDEAEEQENREALLAYFFLWRHAGKQGWTADHLDEAIETFLEPIVGRAVDFEVGDALEKLLRLGIVRSEPSGKLRAVPIQQALAILDQAWDNFFTCGQAA